MNAFTPAEAVPINVRSPPVPIAYSDTVPGSVPLPRLTT